MTASQEQDRAQKERSIHVWNVRQYGENCIQGRGQTGAPGMEVLSLSTSGGLQRGEDKEGEEEEGEMEVKINAEFLTFQPEESSPSLLLPGTMAEAASPTSSPCNDPTPEMIIPGKVWLIHKIPLTAGSSSTTVY